MSDIVINGLSGDVLRQYIMRLEKLEQEKADIASHMKDIFSEARADGFDIQVMKKIIKIRKMKQEEVDEQEALLQLYKRALGMHNDIE